MHAGALLIHLHSCKLKIQRTLWFMACSKIWSWKPNPSKLYISCPYETILTENIPRQAVYRNVWGLCWSVGLSMWWWFMLGPFLSNDLNFVPRHLNTIQGLGCRFGTEYHMIGIKYYYWLFLIYYRFFLSKHYQLLWVVLVDVSCHVA